MSKVEEIKILRDYGYPISEIARLFFPDLELSKAKLKIASILWRLRKKEEKEKKSREYWEPREYWEMRPDRHWTERYELIEPDLYIESPDMMELKKRGMLPYEDERYLETKLFLKILYDKYFAEHDSNTKVVWRAILHYNKILNREIWKKRPGTRITKKMVSYLIIILIKIYLDYGYPWIKETIEKLKKDYEIKEKELEKMLPLLAKIL